MFSSQFNGYERDQYLKEEFEKFARSMGLGYLPFSGGMIGKIDKDRLPQSEVTKADYDYLLTLIKDQRDTVFALLDFLGAHTESGKRVVKNAPAKAQK